MPSDNTSPFSSSRFMIAFVLTVLIAFGAYISWKLYEFRRGEEAVRNLAGALKDWEREQYERAMADTYGGTTPEETLRFYIDAVEKGDYELASRYLLEEKRSQEINALSNMSQEQISKYVVILKQLKTQYKDDTRQSMEAPTGPNQPNLRAIFFKYPNGIWKIESI